jgi:hypothetical protein
LSIETQWSPCAWWAVRPSRFFVVALAAILSLISPAPGKTQTGDSIEYQLKAAFLFNFAKFVEWPQTSFQNERAPITLCVFRYDPFGSSLSDVIRGKTINNRSLAARTINELPELKGCQLVFVSEREDRYLPEIVGSLKGASVLVVGESEGFADRGGAVQFFLENNKLRFAVNVDAVQRSRILVSSKLLSLARIIHDAGQPKGKSDPPALKPARFKIPH